MDMVLNKELENKELNALFNKKVDTPQELINDNFAYHQNPVSKHQESDFCYAGGYHQPGYLHKVWKSGSWRNLFHGRGREYSQKRVF